MELSQEIKYELAEELVSRLDDAHYDGLKKNILLRTCPFCGCGKSKFGIYIGPDMGRKTFGACHCFKCGRGYRSLADTLTLLDCEDLIPKQTVDLESTATIGDFDLFVDEIDDNLVTVELPEGYKRSYDNRYLKDRGWVFDDYEYFEAGTNRGLERKYEDYVILPIRMNGDIVGFVARHTWSKDDIDNYNETHRFKIRRYMNSTDNGFAKLLYNYDSIDKYKTDTVVLCEGVFDVVALTRKLELYDNKRIVPVCTFGKKVSEEQLYFLQQKGVRNVIFGYDSDARMTTAKIAQELEEYFDVLVADVPDNSKDWDEMSDWQVYKAFADHLYTVREFNLMASAI